MPRVRRRARCGVAWLVAALCIWAVLTPDRDASPSITSSTQQPQSPPAVQADEQQARVTCGGCHAFPPPEILPRDAWRNEFVRMMFIRENRLPPIGPPEHGLPRDSAAAGHGAGAAVLHRPRTRASAGAGILAGPERLARSVRATRPDDAGHAGHAGRLARPARRLRRRRAARRARHRHAAGRWSSPAVPPRRRARCRSSRAFRTRRTSR